MTSDEDSKNSILMNKTRITNSLTENISPQMDLAIEQLEKDHYLYRRGSTQVHVQLSLTFQKIVLKPVRQVVYTLSLKAEQHFIAKSSSENSS